MLSCNMMQTISCIARPFLSTPTSCLWLFLCVSRTPHQGLFAVLRNIALPYNLLGVAFSDIRTCVSSFSMACALQDGETALMRATGNGQADAVQALLDAGADRFAEVRKIPCSLMTAHEIILSMGTVVAC